jgi:hypothetical protein
LEPAAFSRDPITHCRLRVLCTERRLTMFVNVVHLFAVAHSFAYEQTDHLYQQKRGFSEQSAHRVGRLSRALMLSASFRGLTMNFIVFLLIRGGGSS